jgi:hypothetical protein
MIKLESAPKNQAREVSLAFGTPLGVGTCHGHLDTQDSALLRGGGTRMAHFVGTPEMESRNCPGGTPRTLNCHNSRLRSWIATRFEPKL